MFPIKSSQMLCGMKNVTNKDISEKKILLKVGTDDTKTAEQRECSHEIRQQ